ncbi:HAAS signaling domain-containing protein [Oceanobacillus picturae]|jgi:hypothetical protein|uniref:HAAS signaling domain-containing protein n=1 Tax=Oceanobacillus picturae TaxID=171693 RepID=UPI003635E9AE
MNEAAKTFQEKLADELDDHPDKESILAEYQAHIYELEQETGKSSYPILVERLGEPEEIASLWKQEAAITPKKTQWLFVILNVAIFLGGATLTIIYHLFDWNWTDILWEGLTKAASLIMVIYTFFWGLLGYEIGKEFGEAGRKLLKKTFLICLIPNLVLMYLVIFNFIPHKWFEPLISLPFIMACIGFTIVLYPVSRLGYKWGRKKSV